jgi:hypothetical protein
MRETRVALPFIVSHGCGASPGSTALTAAVASGRDGPRPRKLTRTNYAGAAVEVPNADKARPQGRAGHPARDRLPGLRGEPGPGFTSGGMVTPRHGGLGGSS